MNGFKGIKKNNWNQEKLIKKERKKERKKG